MGQSYSGLLSHHNARRRRNDRLTSTAARNRSKARNGEAGPGKRVTSQERPGGQRIPPQWLLDEAALETLQEQIAAERLTDSTEYPDMSEPLLWQVACMRAERYDAWVHSAHVFENGSTSARLFASPALEMLTRTPWWVVPALWLPLAVYFIVPFLSSKPSMAEASALAVAALCLWTLTEYSVHRFIFHFDRWHGTGDHPAARVLHFLLHGLHHKTPRDKYRLVLPPLLTMVLMPTLWWVYKHIFFLLTEEAFRYMFGVGLIGYVTYDCTHYALHHGGPAADQLPLWNYLVRLHVRHHALDGKGALGFGITSPLWDNVMATAINLKGKP